MESKSSAFSWVSLACGAVALALPLALFAFVPPSGGGPEQNARAWTAFGLAIFGVYAAVGLGLVGLGSGVVAFLRGEEARPAGVAGAALSLLVAAWCGAKLLGL
jgi:hypothetical protein